MDKLKNMSFFVVVVLVCLKDKKLVMKWNILKDILYISLYIVILALHGTFISQRPELV